MTEALQGWNLLHSKLPPAAIKPLATNVYGVAGLSDVNEGFLVRRLFKSGLDWHWRVIRQEYLGAEDRSVRDKDYTQRYYLAMVHGELTIDGKVFHGSGGSDNRKLDAAMKGAGTVAFKNACKWAGLTAELFLEGKAIDDIHGRVLKDPEMVPETVQGLVEKITETYGDPAQQAQDAASKVAMTAPSNSGPINGSAAPASAESEGVSAERSAEDSTPARDDAGIPSDDDLIDLFVLARTLKTPATNVYVRNEVAEHGIAAVRRRLILAHAEPKNCGRAACVHVAQLSGFLATTSLGEGK